MAFLSLIGATLFGAGTFLAGVTTFVLKTVVGIGLSLLAQAIAGKPKPPAFAIEGTLRAGDEVPRSFTMGRTMTAGSAVYRATWGNVGKTPNAYYTEVIAIGDLPGHSLVGSWVDGEEVTILTGSPHVDFGFPVEEYRKSGKDHLWFKWYDGSQVVADPYLVAKLGSHPEWPYESTRVGVGVAYVIVTALINDELFQSFPECKFVVDGVPLYDPSKDTTAGGAGTQRWNNPATWGGDGDDYPAVQLYNIFRGVTFDGQWLYGLQDMSAARLPSANWIAAIEKCRALVDIPGSLTESAFRAGIEVKCSVEMRSAISEFTATCQARIAEVGGVYKIHLGDPDPAVATITDADILTTSEQSFTPFLGIADTINGMVGRFPNPDDAWNTKALAPIYRSDLEELDGNRRLLSDINLPAVPYEFQAQRLLISALEEARRAARKTFVLPAWAWVLEPNDTVEITSARDGDTDKLYRVDGTVDQPDLTVAVDITEIDPADYTPPDIGDYTIVVAGTVGRPLPPSQPIVDWSAVGTTVDNDEGHKTPGILLGWDGDQDDVDRVLFEVRRDGDTDPFHSGTVYAVSRGSIVITQALAPSTIYEVRGRYDSDSGRAFDWSAWLSVTTPALQISTGDLMAGAVTVPIIGPDAAKLIDNQLGSIANTVSEAINREIQIRKVMRQTATSFAAVSERITVVADDTGALADIVTDVVATLNDTTASTRFRMSAITAPMGVAARIEAQARVGQTGTGGQTTWRTAGWAIDVIDEGADVYTARFTIYADQILVVNSLGDEVLYYDTINNVLTIFSGMFIAGVIRSEDGQWFQDMINKQLIIKDEFDVVVYELGFFP